MEPTIFKDRTTFLQSLPWTRHFKYFSAGFGVYTAKVGTNTLVKLAWSQAKTAFSSIEVSVFSKNDGLIIEQSFNFEDIIPRAKFCLCSTVDKTNLYWKNENNHKIAPTDEELLTLVGEIEQWIALW